MEIYLLFFIFLSCLPFLFLLQVSLVNTECSSDAHETLLQRAQHSYDMMRQCSQVSSAQLWHSLFSNPQANRWPSVRAKQDHCFSQFQKCSLIILFLICNVITQVAPCQGSETPATHCTYLCVHELSLTSKTLLLI